MSAGSTKRVSWYTGKTEGCTISQGGGESLQLQPNKVRTEPISPEKLNSSTGEENRETKETRGKAGNESTRTVSSAEGYI